MGNSKNTAEEPARTVVYLGNRDAIEVVTNSDGGTERRALPKGKRATTVVLGEDLPLMAAAYDITHPGRGVWSAHSSADAPAWVASTDPDLAQLLAAHWKCEIREPDPDDGTEPATDDDDVEG